METILRPPQWPVALSNFVTWCLMWDPQNRPTSAEAMRHEYFTDAVDPLQTAPRNPRPQARRQPSTEGKSHRESSENPANSARSSWFRKSIIRNSSPVVPTRSTQSQIPSPVHSPVHAKGINVNAVMEAPPTIKHRPFASKRATWANGTRSNNAAPMPILPSIRPISPFSNTVTAQAHGNPAHHVGAQNSYVTTSSNPQTTKKLGRQLSIQSNGSHYADYHRQEAERALNGQRGPMSPNSEQKEGFFSHLRKRARRFSGKPHAPASPNMDETDVNVGCSPWQSNRNSMIIDSNMDAVLKKSFSDVDKALQSARPVVERLSPSPEAPPSHKHQLGQTLAETTLERHPSLSKSVSSPSLDSSSFIGGNGGPISSRTRRALHRSTHPSHMYDTPDEEDELLHDALNSAQHATKGIDRPSNIHADENLGKSTQADNGSQQKLRSSTNNMVTLNPYPTPSPSARRNGMLFDHSIMTEPVTPLETNKNRSEQQFNPRFPTPPYDEHEWAASAAASIFAAGSIYH